MKILRRAFLLLICGAFLSVPAIAAPPTRVSSESVVRVLFSGTSSQGKRLNASELRHLVLYGPMPGSLPVNSPNWHLKVGVFLLSVRPDGSVEKVATLQATGHGGLDLEIVGDLKRWRFRPNSVREARVPAVYGVHGRR